jgi:hypothetical protein
MVGDITATTSSDEDLRSWFSGTFQQDDFQINFESGFRCEYSRSETGSAGSDDRDVDLGPAGGLHSCAC